ncbi:MAG: type IV pilus modification PilV family protein [Gammaproteobacteria bacterium]
MATFGRPVSVPRSHSRNDSVNKGTQAVRALRGFSLIEVVVAMALISMLVLGLSATWVTVDDHFYRLNLRQRAIFLANNEMERLASLGRHTDFFSLSEGTFQDDAGARWIYRGAPVFTGSPPQDLVVTVNALSTPTKTPLTWDERQILFLDTDAVFSPTTELNVLWLDQANNVTARFEFEIIADSASIGTHDMGGCLGDSCHLIEVRVSYPYRFVDGVDPAEDSMGGVETIALRTIVGQRQ